jgi:hypothetical protein
MGGKIPLKTVEKLGCEKYVMAKIMLENRVRRRKTLKK